MPLGGGTQEPPHAMALPPVPSVPSLPVVASGYFCPCPRGSGAMKLHAWHRQPLFCNDCITFSIPFTAPLLKRVTPCSFLSINVLTRQRLPDPSYRPSLRGPSCHLPRLGVSRPLGSCEPSQPLSGRGLGLEARVSRRPFLFCCVWLPVLLCPGLLGAPARSPSEDGLPLCPTPFQFI